MSDILDKPDTRAGAPKGLVDPRGAAQRLRLATYPPSAALAPFVEYFWAVQWDMRERAPETQRVLPYPNAHLVFDEGRSAIHGVVRGAFDRTVSGAGRVLGVRFHAGGLRPFIDRPLAQFADRTVPLDAALKDSAHDAELRVHIAGLAQALGFFDQAHLTRDFTRLVGHSPMAYWRSQQATQVGSGDARRR